MGLDTDFGSHRPVSASSHKHTHKCACELNFCPVCRAPRCKPTRPSKWVDGTLKSIYGKDYDEKHVPPHDRRKGEELLPSGRFYGQTTNRADFTPKRATRTAGKGGDRNFVTLPFDGTTTYRAFHDGKHGPASEPLRKAVDDWSVPFNGLTTNNADFKRWPLQSRATPRPATAMPPLPFDGTTTYRDDFDRKKIPARDPRQLPQLLPSNNLANYTTYGTDFVGHPLDASGHSACCDHAHHPTVHMHGIEGTLRRGTQLVGTATGKLYRV